MEGKEAYSFRVYGVVQGVNFRYEARLKAIELGVTGWIRNLNDGSVEGYAEGAIAAVRRFLEWCRIGPRMARVEGIIIKQVMPENFEGFIIKQDF